MTRLSFNGGPADGDGFAFWNTTMRDLPVGTLLTVNMIGGKPIPISATLPSGEVVTFGPPDQHERN
jgi:hypothetical protein